MLRVLIAALLGMLVTHFFHLGDEWLYSDGFGGMHPVLSYGLAISCVILICGLAWFAEDINKAIQNQIMDADQAEQQGFNQ